jgi:hypothetical protein
MKRTLSLVLLIFVAACFLITLIFVTEPGLRQDTEPVVMAQEPLMVYLPMVVNRYDSQFPASLFGMQMYGQSGPTSRYHPYLVESQSQWLRNRISWAEVEPTNRAPEEFIWSSADRVVAAALPENGGLKLILVIGDGLPDWSRLLANRPYGPIHANALSDFAEFVQALVERYDGDGYLDAPGSPVVKHWEFVNEPDKNNESWGEYSAEYVAALQVFYEAVKAADPGAQVALGGLAYDWFEWQGGPFNSAFLDEVLAAGGGDYFDIMNFHIYPLFAPNWDSNGTGLMEKTAVIRNKLATYGLDKPIIITEAGWYNDLASSDDEQIARLLQFVVQSFAADVKIMIWWMLNDPGSYFQGFGLVTNATPPVPKPSFWAYQTAHQLLGNTLSVRQLTLAETGAAEMEAYRFQTIANTLYVAWLNPYQTSATKPLRLRASQATVLDGMGNQIGPVIVDSDGDGFVNISVTRQPIYILVN